MHTELPLQALKRNDRFSLFVDASQNLCVPAAKIPFKRYVSMIQVRTFLPPATNFIVQGYMLGSFAEAIR